MATNNEIHVVEAQRMDDGVVVTFSDGLCAVYPAALLHASIGLARVMSDLDCEEDPVDAKKRESFEPRGLAKEEGQV